MHYREDWSPHEEEQHDEEQNDDPPPLPQRNPKRGIREMAGDYLREVSSLIVVFALLEKWIYAGKLTPWYVILVVLVSALFFTLGVIAETGRDD